MCFQKYWLRSRVISFISTGNCGLHLVVWSMCTIARRWSLWLWIRVDLDQVRWVRFYESLTPRMSVEPTPQRSGADPLFAALARSCCHHCCSITYVISYKYKSVPAGGATKPTAQRDKQWNVNAASVIWHQYVSSIKPGYVGWYSDIQFLKWMRFVSWVGVSSAESSSMLLKMRLRWL